MHQMGPLKSPLVADALAHKAGWEHSHTLTDPGTNVGELKSFQSLSLPLQMSLPAVRPLAHLRIIIITFPECLGHICAHFLYVSPPSVCLHELISSQTL